MSAAQQGRRHVLVTDAGRGSAVACIRSLGRAGWDVTAADHDRASPGFRSRFVRHRLRYPDPAVDAAGMVEQVEWAVRRHRVDLVLPVTDESALPLASAWERFPDDAVLAVPPAEAWAVTRDKAATIDLARSLGIPTPPTLQASGREGIEGAARELGLPVVIKPVASRVLRADDTVDRFAVSYAGDATELERRVAALGDTTALLQRWLPGSGIGVEVLAHEGRVLAAFQHRRLREVPVTGGASALRVSEPLDPEALASTTTLMEALRWTGLAMVEFRVGPDGSPTLMEINGRVWGSLPLAVAAGMDFPRLAAELWLDGPPAAHAPTDRDYRLGLRGRNIRLELAWIRAVLTGRHRHPALPWPGRLAAVRAAASLFDPRITDDVFDRADPMPGLAQVSVIARDSIGRRGPAHA